jgi:hypothetical protein
MPELPCGPNWVCCLIAHRPSTILVGTHIHPSWWIRVVSAVGMEPPHDGRSRVRPPRVLRAVEIARNEATGMASPTSRQGHPGITSEEGTSTYKQLARTVSKVIFAGRLGQLQVHRHSPSDRRGAEEIRELSGLAFPFWVKAMSMMSMRSELYFYPRRWRLDSIARLLGSQTAKTPSQVTGSRRSG